MAGTRKGTQDVGTPEPEETEPVRTPQAPSFGMCEGVRTDLEQTGKTVDPFTGKTVTRDES